MNQLIAFFAKQHTFVNIITLMVVIAGAWSLYKIKRDAFPNVSFDAVSITTVYPNASAESVEALVTSPLEADLLEVEGVKEMTSTSLQGRSVITLKLDPDVITVNEAESDIQNIVDTFRDLPEGAEDPLVVALDGQSAQPLMEISVGGSVPREELRSAVKRLKRQIEKIDGVSSVHEKGLPEYELRVEANPQKLRKYQLGLTDIVTALQKANVDLPGGTIQISGEAGQSKEVALKTRSKVEDTESIKNVVLRSNLLEQFVTVGDVATVTYGFAEEEVKYRSNQKDGINLVITKQNFADSIRLVDAIQLKIEDMRASLPNSLTVSVVEDQSKDVRNRVEVLSSNLVFGLLLVLVVLSLMLPFRMALVAAIGIPFSFLATILVFDVANISLNLISMMGLIIVLGMLVDDAIVVTENTQRKIDEGMDPEEAAIKGTQEIWKPVVTSILTTLAAFVPLMLMTGIFGKFLQNLPVGVVIALLFSLFECFFILPSHVSKWIRKTQGARGNSQIEKNGSKPGNPSLWRKWVTPSYEWCLRKVLKARYLLLAVTVFGVLFSAVFAKENMKFVFFPGVEAANFNVNYSLPIGTPLERNEDRAKEIETIIADFLKEDLEAMVTTLGLQTKRNGPNVVETRGSHFGQVKNYLVQDRPLTMSLDAIIEGLNQKLKTVPEITDFSIEKGRAGPPVGKALSLRIVGEDQSSLEAGVAEVKRSLSEITGVTSVDDSVLEAREEIEVRIDEKALSLAGLSRAQVANAVRATYDGIVADKIQRLDEEVSILVTLSRKKSQGMASLGATLIPNPKGKLIRLDSVASFETKIRSGSFDHADALRMVRVEAEVNDSVLTSAQLNEIVRENVPAWQKQWPDLSFAFDGEEKDRQESFESLGQTMIFALLAIFLMLTLQFGNIYQPLLVAVTVPLGALAVIWTFYFHGMPLSFLGMIGVIALAGVIVNNAIVFVDFMNREKRNGESHTEAVVNAAKSRLRPIFLTTVTTAVGILPTAYGFGGKDPFVVPIALALGWGMIFGSVLTTLILPVLLAVTHDIVRVLGWVSGLGRSPRGSSLKDPSPDGKGKADANSTAAKSVPEDEPPRIGYGAPKHAKR